MTREDRPQNASKRSGKLFNHSFPRKAAKGGLEIFAHGYINGHGYIEFEV